MKNINPGTRSKIYDFVAFAITILVVLGIIRADDLDAEQITNTVAGVIVVFQAVLARLNVNRT